MIRLWSLRSLSSPPQSVGAECLAIVRALQKGREVEEVEEKRTPVPDATVDLERDQSDQSDRSPLLALIDAFVAHGDLHEVRVPGLDLTVWFVPSLGDVTTLMDEGISRGRIWTAAELRDFMSTGARTPATWTAVILAKLVMGGEITETRRRA